MKGLLRNNFYSMSANLQLAFAMCLVLVFVPIVIGEERLVPVILSMQAFMFIANTGTALNTDVVSKWSCFEITLPVKRQDIIKAKYLSFILLISCGIFMAALTSFLIVCVFETLSADSVIFGLAFGVSLSFITTAFMYPIMLKIGTEKNELIVFISAGIAVVLFLTALTIGTPLVPEDFIIDGNSLVGIIFTLASIVLFAISYFVSLSIYKRKEL